MYLIALKANRYMYMHMYVHLKNLTAYHSDSVSQPLVINYCSVRLDTLGGMRRGGEGNVEMPQLTVCGGSVTLHSVRCNSITNEKH